MQPLRIMVRNVIHLNHWTPFIQIKTHLGTWSKWQKMIIIIISLFIYFDSFASHSHVCSYDTTDRRQLAQLNNVVFAACFAAPEWPNNPKLFNSTHAHEVNFLFHRVSIFLIWCQTEWILPAIQESHACTAELWLAQLLLRRDATTQLCTVYVQDVTACISWKKCMTWGSLRDRCFVVNVLWLMFNRAVK